MKNFNLQQLLQQELVKSKMWKRVVNVTAAVFQAEILVGKKANLYSCKPVFLQGKPYMGVVPEDQTTGRHQT